MDRYIGIITAMDEEMEPIKEKLKELNTKIIYDLSFYEGKVGENKYVLTKSGVGKVNAARNTQIMIDNYDLEYIINIGSAGALNDNLEIYDFVIGNILIQYDFDITAFGHKKGYIPNIGNEIYSSELLVDRYKNKIEEVKEDFSKVIVGKIVTGDKFCTEVQLKNILKEEFRS